MKTLITTTQIGSAIRPRSGDSCLTAQAELGRVQAPAMPIALIDVTPEVTVWANAEDHRVYAPKFGKSYHSQRWRFTT